MQTQQLTKQQLIELEQHCKDLNIGSICYNERCPYRENNMCELHQSEILRLMIKELSKSSN